MTGTPEGPTKSGFMEKPGIEPATPGLQGIALIHYTTGASLYYWQSHCDFGCNRIYELKQVRLHFVNPRFRSTEVRQKLEALLQICVISVSGKGLRFDAQCVRITKTQTSLHICAYAHADLRLCYLHFRKYHIQTFYKHTFNFLASLCS